MKVTTKVGEHHNSFHSMRWWSYPFRSDLHCLTTSITLLFSKYLSQWSLGYSCNPMITGSNTLNLNKTIFLHSWYMPLVPCYLVQESLYTTYRSVEHMFLYVTNQLRDIQTASEISLVLYLYFLSGIKAGNVSWFYQQYSWLNHSLHQYLPNRYLLIDYYLHNLEKCIIC